VDTSGGGWFYKAGEGGGKKKKPGWNHTKKQENQQKNGRDPVGKRGPTYEDDRQVKLPIMGLRNFGNGIKRPQTEVATWRAQIGENEGAPMKRQTGGELAVYKENGK